MVDVVIKTLHSGFRHKQIVSVKRNHFVIVVAAIYTHVITLYPLCEIDIKEKLKEKLGVDFRRYIILGACNPPLAYKTLQEEINIGLLLPCNVIVYEADEAGKSVVAAIDAKTMLSVVGDNPTLKAVATEVNEKLQRVVAQL